MKKNAVFVVWLIVAFFLVRPSDYFIGMNYFNYPTYLIFLITVGDVFLKWKCTDNLLKKLYFILLISQFFLYVSRLANHYPMSAEVISHLIISLTLINIFFFSFQTYFWIKIKSFFCVFSFYVVLNLISMVMFPSGMYSSEIYDGNIWILGYKNMLIRFFLPAMTLLLLLREHSGKKRTFGYVLIFVCIGISILLSKSTTSLLLFLVYLLFYQNRNNIFFQKNITIFRSFVFCIICTICLVVLKVQSNFDTFLNSLFEKGSDFSARNLVWSCSAIKIGKSPLIGFGYHSSWEWRDILNLSFFWGSFSHPHNYILYILLQGGFIYLILLMFAFFVASRVVLRRENNMTFLLTMMYIGFFIEGLMESITSAPFFLPFLGLAGKLKNDTK